MIMMLVLIFELIYSKKSISKNIVNSDISKINMYEVCDRTLQPQEIFLTLIIEPIYFTTIFSILNLFYITSIKCANKIQAVDMK